MDNKLSLLDAISALADEDLIYVAQGGVSLKMTGLQLKTYVGTGAGTDTPILTGNSTGTESTDLIVTVTNWNSDQLLTISVEAGSYVDNNDGTIAWTLPVYTGVDDSHDMSVQATEPSHSISATAAHTVSVTEASIVDDQIILYENATINGTTFPDLVNASVATNNITAIADTASAISLVVEQDGGDGDFINATPTADNTAANFTLDGTSTNLEVIVSGQTLVDGDTVLLNDGASTTLIEFDTTGHVTGGVSAIGNSGTRITVSGADLIATRNADGGDFANSFAYGDTAIAAGDVYFEVVVGANMSISFIGIGTDNTEQGGLGLGGYATGWGYRENGKKATSDIAVAYGVAYTTGDIIGVRYEYATGELTFYKNGASQGIAYTLTPATTVYPAFSLWDANSVETFDFSSPTYQPGGTTLLSKITIDITTASLSNTPTIVAKDTANILTSLVGTGAGNDFVARTAQSHTADATSSPALITDIFDTDTRQGRDFKVKAELADNSDEVSRISIPIQKLG